MKKVCCCCKYYDYDYKVKCEECDDEYSNFVEADESK
jgi:hypothetical protein|nr:MAG TPA: hypothetical protein [Caudoviricetes sp.]